MQRYAWRQLNKQQVGAYAEYFFKMELTMFGFQVYGTEVDDRGIDFVARYNKEAFIEVQVKSVRSLGYTYMKKEKFPLSENFYLAFGILLEGKAPDLYLIPSTVWRTPNSMFCDRDYGKPGQVSPPEWGLSLTTKNMTLLERFRFETIIDTLLRNS